MFIASALVATLALSPPIAPDWRTLAERSGYTQTPRYAETFEYFSKLDAASANAQLIEFGTSPQGRKQLAFVIASGDEFTPLAAKASNRMIASCGELA